MLRRNMDMQLAHCSASEDKVDMRFDLGRNALTPGFRLPDYDLFAAHQTQNGARTFIQKVQIQIAN